MSDNPYSTPEGMHPESTRESALARVSLPSTLLLITGIFSIIGAILSGLMPVFFPQFLEGILAEAAADPDFPAEQREALEMQVESFRTMGWFYFISAGIGLVGAIVMILGSMKMKNLEGYAMAMAGCIAAICPFTSPCCSCIFHIAIGIWGIVVIANQDVKAHFS